MACGREAKGREVEDGTREERGGEERWEEKRGRGLVYWIYLFESRKKNIIHHLIYLLLVGEAALMAAVFGVQGR